MIKKIIRMLTGRNKGTARSCSCSDCVGMCKNPCWPTPHQAVLIMDAGMTRRLKIYKWLDPENVGKWAEVLAPRSENGVCTFFKKGRCELHNRGLKPLEGGLAIHTMSRESANEIHDEIGFIWGRDKLTVKYYLKRRACVQE